MSVCNLYTFERELDNKLINTLKEVNDIMKDSWKLTLFSILFMAVISASRIIIWILEEENGIAVNRRLQKRGVGTFWWRAIASPCLSRRHTVPPAVFTYWFIDKPAYIRYLWQHSCLSSTSMVNTQSYPSRANMLVKSMHAEKDIHGGIATADSDSLVWLTGKKQAEWQVPSGSMECRVIHTGNGISSSAYSTSLRATRFDTNHNFHAKCNFRNLTTLNCPFPLIHLFILGMWPRKLA